jgi:hypothetical protein
MKRILKNLTKLVAIITSGVMLSGINSYADNYIGNGVISSFGGAVGNGVLAMSDDGTNILGGLVVGGGMNDVLVIYIDTGEAGGFTTTTNFNDQDDANRQAISGVSGGNRSVLTFTSGFTPKYAIALDPGSQYYHAPFGGLWQLTNGGNNSFPFKGSVNLTPLTNVGPYSFSFPATSIGLTNHVKKNIKIFGTYVNEYGYRSTESIAGNLIAPFGIGYNPFTQTGYSTYAFASGPAPNYPLVFSVDMTAQIASGAFKPSSNDTVYAAGSFQLNPWSGFQLFPSVGNTNIYVGTNQDFNSPGTPELYKFKFHSVSANNDVWEFGPPNENRPFNSAAGTQTLPLVYFNDVAPRPSVTTNTEVFQIDMTSALTRGVFNPATNQIMVFGTFQTNQWSSGFVLTNNPNGANTNLYSGTYRDGNYPGTWQQYKYVIVSSVTNLNYEFLNNRTFYTPTNSGTLTLAYFNNWSPYTNRVTFQVDMTLPLLTHAFSPGAGDTVVAAGTFQTNIWTPAPNGFVLTNNPNSASSNIYSGTYIVTDPPGTGEYFKFVLNTNNGSSFYETRSDRQFILASAMTNALVYWNDDKPIDFTPSGTTITFTVNMTNAVDIYGYPFDPANDLLFINGDFADPAWNSSPSLPEFWHDSTIDQDFSSYILQNNPPGSQLYTGTFTVPAGHAISVYYKYGIYHNSGNNQINTNVDNEAPSGNDHHRYIRANGTYNFPVDTFGIQATNAAAGVEPLFGDLTATKLTAGKLPISWVGISGVRLQSNTNLMSTNWVDVPNTDGANQTNWPATNGIRFFRLQNYR